MEESTTQPETTPKSNTRKYVIALLVLIVLGLLGWAAVHNREKLRRMVYGSTPADIVADYLTASDQAARLKTVRQYQGTGIRMNAWPGFGFPSKPSEIRTNSSANPAPGYWTTVTTVQDSVISTFYVLNTNTGPKIDWEASVGWQPMTPRQMLESMPVDPTFVRVLASKSRNYTQEYKERRANLLAVFMASVRAPDGPYMVGYIHKDSATGKQLSTLLDDGDKHLLTLLVKFRPYYNAGQNGYVDILALADDDTIESNGLLPNEGGATPSTNSTSSPYNAAYERLKVTESGQKACAAITNDFFDTVGSNMERNEFHCEYVEGKEGTYNYEFAYMDYLSYSKHHSVFDLLATFMLDHDNNVKTSSANVEMYFDSGASRLTLNLPALRKCYGKSSFGGKNEVVSFESMYTFGKCLEFLVEKP